MDYEFLDKAGLDALWAKIKATFGDAKAVLENDITANQNVGGVKSGRNFTKGTSFETIIRAMLYSYIKPTCSIRGGGNYEIGTSNDVTITYVATNSSNSHINKVELYKGGTLIETKNSAGEYSHKFSGIDSNTTFEVKIYDTNESESEMSSASTKCIFYHKLYYGTSESVPTEVPTSGGSLMTSESVDLKDKLKWDNLCFYVMIPYSTGTANVVTQNNETISMDKKTLKKGDLNYTMFYKTSDIAPNVKFNILTISK